MKGSIGHILILQSIIAFLGQLSGLGYIGERISDSSEKLRKIE